MQKIVSSSSSSSEGSDRIDRDEETYPLEIEQ